MALADNQVPIKGNVQPSTDSDNVGKILVKGNVWIVLIEVAAAGANVPQKLHHYKMAGGL